MFFFTKPLLSFARSSRVALDMENLGGNFVIYEKKQKQKKKGENHDRISVLFFFFVWVLECIHFKYNLFGLGQVMFKIFVLRP